MVKIALIGKNKKWKTALGRYLKSAYKFKYLPLDGYLNFVLRNLYHKSKFSDIKWETRTRFYNTWQKIEPDIWVNKVLRLVEMSEPETNIVIPDVRYMNEIEALKKAGFIFIRVISDPSSAQYIKNLSLDSNPGAILYYEHFAPDTIYCKYSFSVNSYKTSKIAAENLIKVLFKEENLT